MTRSILSLSPDGSKIILGSSDTIIHIWDVTTGAEMLPPLRGHDNSIYYVAFSPDELKIISRSYGKTIWIWDASTGIEMLSPLQGRDVLD